MNVRPDIAPATSAPSAAELVARARSMIPALLERGPQGERERNIARETVAEMKAAGFFKILQPKRWGGYEMDVPTCFDVQLALGEGDMSTAWVYGVVGLHPCLLAIYDDRAAQEVWGDDNSVLMSSSLMPAGTGARVDGGFRLSGHWKYSSGSAHCDWAFLGGVVKDGDREPERRLFLLPRRDYTIVDTWHVPGLKATGSNDIVVKEVFVPDYRTIGFLDTFRGVAPGHAVNPGLLYKLPFGQVFFRGISNASLGALQGMLNAFVGYAGGRASWQFGRAQEDPVVQQTCAEVALGIGEMTALLRQTIRTLEDYAARGEMPPLTDRMLYKYHSAAVGERCSQLASRLFKCTGGAGLFADQPFGRMLADITAARQHLSNQVDQFGRAYGATLFGIVNNKDLVL
jgi:3-hydroxy-9,10-secoandrosta-1,3,5(10)-triene-9,17-dione monooxygenase